RQFALDVRETLSLDGAGVFEGVVQVAQLALLGAQFTIGLGGQRRNDGLQASLVAFVQFEIDARDLSIRRDDSALQPAAIGVAEEIRTRSNGWIHEGESYAPGRERSTCGRVGGEGRGGQGAR